MFTISTAFPALKATVTVNRNLEFQKIVGFGGAITGTVTHLLNQLPLSLVDFVLKYEFVCVA